MLRFTIRDVFWLTVVVALYVAWSLHASSLRREAAVVSSKYTRLEIMAAALSKSNDAAGRRLKACLEARQRDQAAQNKP